MLLNDIIDYINKSSHGVLHAYQIDETSFVVVNGEGTRISFLLVLNTEEPTKSRQISWVYTPSWIRFRSLHEHVMFTTQDEKAFSMIQHFIQSSFLLYDSYKRSWWV